MTSIDPLVTALFVVVAFMTAGLVHSAWLASAASRALLIPIDGRLRLRGRRLFGDNKTVRGFVAMPPASALSFWALASMLETTAPSVRDRMWPLTPMQFAALGLWAGLGFMLGELPNSFAKRQLDIAPGDGATGSIGSVVSFVVDRFDSIVGAMAAISLATPTPWQTWAYVALVGPVIHLGFSILLFRLGVKARPA
ncbi:MAG: CDP-archaeol synthase [Gemmatimonadota bacterium]